MVGGHACGRNKRKIVTQWWPTNLILFGKEKSNMFETTSDPSTGKYIVVMAWTER